MNKKIFFFDIDGTLFSQEIGHVTQAVKDAIKRARDAGHYCFVASGRPYGYIAENIREIGFDGYVLANGAHIKYDEKDYTDYLNQEHVSQLCQSLEELGIEYVIQTTDYCYIDQSYEKLLNFYKLCNIDFNNFSYETDVKHLHDQIVKIEMWVNTEEEYKTVCNLFDHFKHELHPDNHSMEVYSSITTKATGILNVVSMLGIPLENTYCFGDGPNDVEMFETVAHPIEIGRAHV